MLHMVQTRNLHGKVVCSVPVLQIMLLVKLRGMHILRMNRVLNFLLIERSYYNSLMMDTAHLFDPFGQTGLLTLAIK